MAYQTQFGSLASYSKGRVDPIDDDVERYAFSNLFEVASHAKPYEKIAVAKNLEYVIEAIRAEGTSEWRVAPHDESALILDGVVTVELLALEDPPTFAEGTQGSVRLPDDPAGTPMGHIIARNGHMVLLPKGRAYRFCAEAPSVMLLQTIAGVDTIEKWSEIRQSAR
jgi:hypothetical protein